MLELEQVSQLLRGRPAARLHIVVQTPTTSDIRAEAAEPEQRSKKPSLDFN